MTTTPTEAGIRAALPPLPEPRGRLPGGVNAYVGADLIDYAIAALRASAVPQAQQGAQAAEPVAWRVDWPDWTQYHDADDPLPDEWDEPPGSITPLYAGAPPVQELSDAQIREIHAAHVFDERQVFSYLAFARAVLKAAASPLIQKDQP